MIGLLFGPLVLMKSLGKLTISSFCVCSFGRDLDEFIRAKMRLLAWSYSSWRCCNVLICGLSNVFPDVFASFPFGRCRTDVSILGVFWLSFLVGFTI